MAHAKLPIILLLKLHYWQAPAFGGRLTYYLSLKTNNGKLKLAHEQFKKTKLYSDLLEKCVEFNISEYKPINIPEPQFKCEVEGIFKDENDITCKWYYRCKHDRDGSLQKSHEKCPGSTYFSYRHHGCVGIGETDCFIGTALPSETTATTLPTTIVPPTIKPTNVLPFTCTKEGRFKDALDVTCKMYYLCVIGDNGKFNLGHYSCPGTTLFSIRYKRCVNADLSACEPLTSTTTPTETNPPQTTQASTTESPEFICESEGRFKDEQDLTCITCAYLAKKEICKKGIISVLEQHFLALGIKDALKRLVLVVFPLRQHQLKYLQAQPQSIQQIQQ
ncbi:uncharacterized protein LOC113373831 [Ctenocephalides felis]|uniref:uncharacterized protein LOC113373831 n=1 Tax=Ctenocephalides felis TaxID=7515 RepID=UPI000E6E39D1|nr:uncharacterized protein LOC113373831 [Ctenocephalides felis]